MSDTLSGFPFSTLEFDADGNVHDAAALTSLIALAKSAHLTDLFVFSHGWNNDHAAALSLYQRFFAEVAKIAGDPNTTRTRPATIGVVGVLWPSILWPDDAASAASTATMGGASTGGVASLAATAPVRAAETTPAAINAELRKAYGNARQRALLDTLTGYLETQPKTDAALTDFQTTLAELLASELPAGGVDRHRPDEAEGAIGTLSAARWRDLLDTLGDNARARGDAHGGAAGLGDQFRKLWDGAKDALRVGTYWQMKQRAGVVGQTGLGPALARIAAEVPGLRIHLLGHSFGARLVSFSLAGLPSGLTGSASPVKSLFLLQGAFSHYAFADALPHDRARSGALKGMASRVDGPLVTTHSLKDSAVGLSYPAASIVNGDDAAAADDQFARWGAMGHDGAQAVSATSAPLGAPGTRYSFTKGQWVNLDGNAVIIHGAPPSGAHSDIAHPQTAWAALAAAGIV